MENHCLVRRLAAPFVVLAFVGPAQGEGEPHARVSPGVVRWGQHATIAVSAIHTRSLEVRLRGATDRSGRQLPWRPLHLSGGRWTGILPAPALRGMYPVELRTGRRASPFRLDRTYLRVFARGTRARPSFVTPAGAARWWVRAVASGRLVAVRAWARPAFDRREPGLHRLFVVAYSPPGRPAARDRLGMFVEVFRDGYRARWRLLEATVAP
jgi:hypothetical protein